MRSRWWAEAPWLTAEARGAAGQKTLEVKKNRYSGDLGAVSLGFNRVAKTFRDLLAHGDA